MSDSSVNLWSDELHAVQYLDRADTIPHRSEGEAALLEWLPRPLECVLDLGTGDGRLLSIVTGVGLLGGTGCGGTAATVPGR